MISLQNNLLKRVFSNFNPYFKDFFNIPVLLATAFRFCIHLDILNFKGMEIQRHCHRPNQPPHFEKFGGKNLTQQPNFTTNAKNQTSPLVFLHFSRLGTSPSPLALRLYQHKTLQYLPQNQPF